MPSLRACEEHWNVAHGRCLRCGQAARCERAHIIDRSAGGLDGVQNVAPLCYPCHDDMPPFWPGDEDRALSWLAEPDGLRWRLRLADRIRDQHPVEWAAAFANPTLDDALVRLPVSFEEQRLPV